MLGSVWIGHLTCLEYLHFSAVHLLFFKIYFHVRCCSPTQGLNYFLFSDVSLATLIIISSGDLPILQTNGHEHGFRPGSKLSSEHYF